MECHSDSGRRSVTRPRHLGNAKTGRDSQKPRRAGPSSERPERRTQRPMFLDEFEFVKRLGEGAFATVWAARRKDPGGPNHGKLYAVKHLKQADDGAAGKGLLGTPEFRSLKSIARHPNVLRAVQVARERGQVFLVTEWCDDNLLSIVETARERGLGRVPEDVTRAALSHLLEALAHCHDARWVHRDVKPENVLVARGVAKLADFGEACGFDGDDALRTYVGTRWYRAPEQFVFERHAADEYRVVTSRWRNPGAADVWAAGCVMCECYLGHALFRGNSSADMLRKIADVLGDGGGCDASNQSSVELARGWPVAANDDACVPRGPDRLADAFGGDGIGADALDLVRVMLAVDPARRITARAALAHPFFSSRRGGPLGEVVLPSSRMEPSTATVRLPIGASIDDDDANGHARTFQKTDDDAERRRRIRAAALARLSDSDDDEFDFSPPSAAPTASTIEAPAGRRTVAAALPEDAIPTTPTPEAVAAMDAIRRAHSRVGASTAPTPPAARAEASIGGVAAGVAGVRLDASRPAGSDTEPSRPAASPRDRPVPPAPPPPARKKKSLLDDSDSDDDGFHAGVVRPAARSALTSRRVGGGVAAGVARGIGGRGGGGGGDSSSDEGDGARKIAPL